MSSSTDRTILITFDTDWATEDEVEHVLELAGKTPVTPFITGPYECIAEKFRGNEERVGVHPNFERGSTQGGDPREVVQYVRSLWPKATMFRTHRLGGGQNEMDLLRDAEMKVDSNFLASMDDGEGLKPIVRWNGLISLPIWYMDNIDTLRYEIEKDEVMWEIEKPGLKVLDFHPQYVCRDQRVREVFESVAELGGEYMWDYVQRLGR